MTRTTRVGSYAATIKAPQIGCRASNQESARGATFSASSYLVFANLTSSTIAEPLPMAPVAEAEPFWELVSELIIACTSIR